MDECEGSMNYQSTNLIKKRGMITAAAMIMGLVVAGTGAGNAMAMQAPASAADSSQTAPMTGNQNSQAAVEFKVALNGLLREHVSSSLNVTRSIVGGASERQINGAIEAQYANSDALAAAVGSVYGGGAQAQFSELFREHIVESNKYAMAVAAGDRTAADAANMELKEYLADISNFFVGAIPGLKYNEVYGFLNEHEELINKSTDAFKAGDFVQSYQMEREALKQVSIASNALSTGIVATQPNLFK